MPIFRKKDENFFKAWSDDMAYILGFFAADGSMYKTNRGTHFIEFQITDGDLLFKIRESLGSNHKITERISKIEHRKLVYRLQIGSKEMFRDLVNLGLMQNKSKILHLPVVLEPYFGDFLRGYFDGDGDVEFGYYQKPDRKYLSKIFLTRFTSGSYFFMKELEGRLAKIDICGSRFFASGAWRLSYGSRASEKLFKLMYSRDDGGDLIYLERKYKIFQDALVSKNNAGVV